jgi:exodeoxyribonuclease V gamma subunit
MPDDIKPGFIALHSNRLEGLAQIVSTWLERYTLAPLELERVITLSSATAEWFKIWMAREHGVFAGSTVDLPGRVIWDLYRSLLQGDSQALASATDQKTLVWRLMRLLPALYEAPEFVALKDYVHQGGPKAHYELAKKIADTYDLYQIYRADWLESWSRGECVVLTAKGLVKPLSQDQRWQALLWKALCDEMNEPQRQSIRSVMHAQAMSVLKGLEKVPQKWPRRLILFGVTALPMQVLEFLAQMSKFTQVIVCVHSPCQYHWADVMQGREFFQASKKRLKSRGGVDLSATPLDQMHLHANALLAQWGRQARDFVRQLDEFDDVHKTQEEFTQLKVELFEHGHPESISLLESIQNQIRDLEPIQAQLLSDQTDDAIRQKNDGSIVFHIAHSLTRELEILHDQLLSLMAPGARASRIDPKDIVVMCPDVAQSKAAIHAIFGQYRRNDPRFIPYDVADTQALQTHPMMQQLEWLLHIESSRCTLSEVMSFASSSFVATRFDLENTDVEQLKEWLIESGVRWGLDGFQRDALGFSSNGSIHTFAFGVRRMLLGLATGEMDVLQRLDEIKDIEPMTSVSGLESQILGRFDNMVQKLIQWWSLSTKPAKASEWIERYRDLIEQFFQATNNEEIIVLEAMSRGLVTWSDSLQAADFDEILQPSVAHAAWIDHLQIASPKQRLLASGVTFCSIKSMRTLPFKVVCMIGMSDGDFPATLRVQDFDLTKEVGLQRVGDQSRSEDDRAMMLESLLAAREVLYISWSGLSPRDNSTKPPSVLVTQLRQYMAIQWGDKLLEDATTLHPLQPFNRVYFEEHSPYQTYAHEWREIHTTDREMSEFKNSSIRAEITNSNEVQMKEVLQTEKFIQKRKKQALEIRLSDVLNFYKNPVKDYFIRELSVNFNAVEVQSNDFDHENFRLKGLELFKVKDQILKSLVDQPERLALAKENIGLEIQKLKRSGVWTMGAMGDLFESQLQSELLLVLEKYESISDGLKKDSEAINYYLEMPEVYESCVLMSPLKLRATLRDEREHCSVKILANALKASKETRHDLLLAPWLDYLFLSSLGLGVHCLYLFSDAWIEFSTPNQLWTDEETFQDSKSKSLSILKELIKLCIDGQEQLLPMPIKTALKYVQEKNTDKALSNAKKIYEGVEELSHYESQDMSMARVYPTFDDLVRNPETLAIWVRVYAPFVEWLDKLDIHDYQVLAAGESQ